MAMVGTVVMSAPRANDLHGFLAKANLERFYYRLEHELKLDSVSRLRELNDFSDLVQLGMTKKEIGNLRKQLKREDHPTGGTFSLLRSKPKPVKSVKGDVQNSPSSGQATTSASTAHFVDRLRPEQNEKCPSREVQCGSNKNQESVVKRGSLKRSMSAATDHSPSCHPLNRVHSTAHPSCASGQRFAIWNDERSDPGLSKRFSLRTDDPRLNIPSGKHQMNKNDSKPASPMTEVLTVLAGPPPFPIPPTPTDRSPLIETDKPPVGNSFDNVAASSGSINRNSSGAGLLLEPSKGEPVQTVQKPPSAVVAKPPEGKRRKWFPQLRVKIPEDDNNARPNSKVNIKKLSASDERKIDEALELAGTFARLGTSEHFASTPRTPGASSKESKESLTSSTESPTTTHFRFGHFRSRKEEKKTFAEELTRPNDLLTPEALEAYEELVSKGAEGGLPLRARPQKQSTRLAHRLSLRVKISQHGRPNRGASLSESDKGVASELVKTSPGRGRSVRFGSTGRTLGSLSGDQGLFVWLDKSPFNPAKQDSNRQRPKSLQSDFAFKDSTGGKFPLSMPSNTPPIRGKDFSCRQENPRRAPPPLPQGGSKDFCPPPAVPPRVPLRQSTVNSKPRQRQNPLPSDKQRSYSEGTSYPDGARVTIPRRDIRSSSSTDDTHSSSPEPHSPTGSKRLDVTLGSDDSVFHPRSPCLVAAAAFPRQQRSLSAKNVDVDQLGSLDLVECHSESDLLREALTPIPGRYETSDCISYEDLMEFALENRPTEICDEVRLMRKRFCNEISVSDCMDALVSTGWVVHSAIKLIQLKQLLNAGIGSQEECKEALMASNWNVDEAASFLLASAHSQ